MWVKICGTTNLPDALLAYDAGADAIGFVFAPSKRQVTAAEASEIIQQLPENSEKVGVFLNGPVEQVRQIAKEAGLTGIQLHGNESPEDAEMLVHCDFRIIKGLHAGPDLSHEIAKWAQVPGLFALLIDSGNPIQGGGTGKTFDWDALAAIRNEIPPDLQIIVAGGLSPDNVSDAITRLRPWGVDVVSGVEVSPGKKDPQKVRALVQAARNASQ